MCQWWKFELCATRKAWWWNLELFAESLVLRPIVWSLDLLVVITLIADHYQSRELWHTSSIDNKTQHSQLFPPLKMVVVIVIVILGSCQVCYVWQHCSLDESRNASQLSLVIHSWKSWKFVVNFVFVFCLGQNDKSGRNSLNFLCAF